MRRRLCAALLLTVCLVWGEGQELENAALIQVLGVDGREPVRLTALAGGEEQPVYEGLGQDLRKAREVLEGAGDKRLELTHVAHVVLGSDADGPEALLQAVTHRKSGYEGRLWLARGEAAGILAASGDPAARLSSLADNAGAEAPTLLEALTALRRDGFAVAPLLDVEGGELKVTGYGTLEAEDGT